MTDQDDRVRGGDKDAPFQVRCPSRTRIGLDKGRAAQAFQVLTHLYIAKRSFLRAAINGTMQIPSIQSVMRRHKSVSPAGSPQTNVITLDYSDLEY